MQKYKMEYATIEEISVQACARMTYSPPTPVPTQNWLTLRETCLGVHHVTLTSFKVGCNT